MTQRQRRRLRKCLAWLVLISIVAFIFGCGTLFGRHLGTVHNKNVEDKLPVPVTKQVAPSITLETVSYIPEPEPEPEYLLIDSIPLSYDLQVLMQELCEKYKVPYALVLAAAEKESRFDPDAKSKTGDYGLMQINKINYEWLQERGIDPLTCEGNVEAGVLMLAERLEKYGDIELALMAYNCGNTGAKRLWDAGIYSTAYSRSVMELYKQWLELLEVM